jgi:hypothetical protein
MPRTNCRKKRSARSRRRRSTKRACCSRNNRRRIRRNSRRNAGPTKASRRSDWDFTRFNPEFFRHYEKRIGQLRDLGIEADLILFNPYGRLVSKR